MTDPVVDNLVDTVHDQATGRTLPRALRPFRSPSYRRLAVALVFSSFGQGVWIIGLVWEVIRIGGGPAQLSIASTAGAVGVMLPALFAGVVADRVPQRTILMAVCALELAGVGAIAVLSLTDQTALWHLALVVVQRRRRDVVLLPGLLRMAARAGRRGGPAGRQRLRGHGASDDRPGARPRGGRGRRRRRLAGRGRRGRRGVVRREPGRPRLRPPTPVRRQLDDEHRGHPVRSALRDMAEGFRYMVQTPWLLATLAFACLMTLAVMGPLEVLIPFLLKDTLGGGPGDHAMVLGAFGLGGAAGSLVMASIRMPRRYLTLMNLLWGVSCLPFLVMAGATAVWMVVASAFVMGALFSAPMVIWGTLLQRRVPAELLGRVSSLDFFVSLALMPVSMALAAPVADAIGLAATFTVAGLVPVAAAVVTVVWARLPADEVANPLR